MRTAFVGRESRDEVNAPQRNLSRPALAGVSLLGALLASSCCIVPLLLVILGVGGAWVGTLAALQPYQPYFVALALGLLGLGYWQVYRKPGPACDADGYCTSVSSRITRIVLWSASLLVLASITVGYWAPFFY